RPAPRPRHRPRQGVGAAAWPHRPRTSPRPTTAGTAEQLPRPPTRLLRTITGTAARLRQWPAPRPGPAAGMAPRPAPPPDRRPRLWRWQPDGCVVARAEHGGARWCPPSADPGPVSARAVARSQEVALQQRSNARRAPACGRPFRLQDVLREILVLEDPLQAL